jgi:hypothetical protein
MQTIPGHLFTSNNQQKGSQAHSSTCNPRLHSSARRKWRSNARIPTLHVRRATAIVYLDTGLKFVPLLSAGVVEEVVHGAVHTPPPVHVHKPLGWSVNGGDFNAGIAA